MVRGLLGRQRGALELALGPEEEGLDHGLGVDLAVGALGRAAQGACADLGLDAVELADARERLGDGLGLEVFGPLEAAAGVRPALGERDADSLGILGIDPVAVAEQHHRLANPFAERLANMNGRPRGSIEEDDVAASPVVGVAPDRPEVAGLELTLALAPSLDWGLVHGLDPAGANSFEHGRDDGGEQQRHGQHLCGEPLAGDLDTGRPQALVLAIQRQVVEELVDDQAGEEAHIRAPALQHRRRGARTGQGGCLLELDHRAHVPEHHVAARALGQAMGHLLADDLIGVRRQVGDRRIGDRDGLHRHPLRVEEQRWLLALVFAAHAPAPLVGGHRLGGYNGRGRVA